MDAIAVPDRAALEAVLATANVATTAWGSAGRKSVAELFAELAEGEATLARDAGGRLVRLVAVVRVRVTFGDQVLVEERQVFVDPARGERRRHLPYLAEKRHAHEAPEAAAQRALREELGIDAIPAERLQAGGNTSSIEDSPSYPGLQTVYLFHDFTVDLPAERYVPDGYIERQATKYTHFVWQQTLS